MDSPISWQTTYCKEIHITIWVDPNYQDKDCYIKTKHPRNKTDALLSFCVWQLRFHDFNFLKMKCDVRHYSQQLCKTARTIFKMETSAEKRENSVEGNPFCLSDLPSASLILQINSPLFFLQMHYLSQKVDNYLSRLSSGCKSCQERKVDRTLLPRILKLGPDGVSLTFYSHVEPISSPVTLDITLVRL